MKKKLVSVLLCVAMVATMLVGCGGKSDDSDKEASGGGGNEIYMFISQPEYADAINELIDEYKNVEPDVTINYETTQNDYPTLLKAKLNSGDAPDIFSSTAGKEIEVYKEYSLDLSDQPLMETMLPAVQDTMKDANGEGTYGIAIKGNFFGLLYNKDLFEQAGIDKAPETVEELTNAVKKLKDAGITPFTGGFAEWWVFKHLFQHYAGAAVEDYQSFVAAMESGEDSLNNYPLMKDNFFDFVDLVKENGDAKPLEADLSAEVAAFGSGKAAIMAGQGAWVEADVLKINPDLKIGFTGYPVSDDPEDAKVITGADQALRINKDSKNKDAVLDFINWWYTSDYGISWFTDVAGVVPPVETTAESDFEVIKQGNELVAEKGSGALGVIYSTDSFHTAFGEAMQAYVEGSASKEDTISTIETKWVEIDGSTTE
ncbi:raffinose/stachyose/melibiose transport system substrate-binding protein [Aequitasia blattaphilus]|uniref:Extracellular solute-binding protein n=1 Tax=Aequitasia blattaphilus TaxID=2949332 RepID=A0ABT1EAY7_9FIRM|nr:extracellular solute-binding protein [Aequitasia blattaphilus]MCP1103003.1 extracellular solute-binding protein [Aequitasia blattaphilus]MCR8615643.1 extracellular solute-binding protein [Aequitasia blattaphilus]